MIRSRISSLKLRFDLVYPGFLLSLQVQTVFHWNLLNHLESWVSATENLNFLVGTSGATASEFRCWSLTPTARECHPSFGSARQGRGVSCSGDGVGWWRSLAPSFPGNVQGWWPVVGELSWWLVGGSVLSSEWIMMVCGGGWLIMFVAWRFVHLCQYLVISLKWLMVNSWTMNGKLAG